MIQQIVAPVLGIASYLVTFAIGIFVGNALGWGKASQLYASRVQKMFISVTDHFGMDVDYVE